LVGMVIFIRDGLVGRELRAGLLYEERGDFGVGQRVRNAFEEVDSGLKTLFDLDLRLSKHEAGLLSSIVQSIVKLKALGLLADIVVKLLEVQTYLCLSVVLVDGGVAQEVAALLP